MADPALSALFDNAQSPPVKMMICSDCGAGCVRTSGRQLRCLSCRGAHTIKTQQERNKRIPRKNGMLGSIFSCGVCGVDVVRSHANEKRCDGCKRLTKGRREPSSLLATILCCDCGVSCRRDIRATRCFECASTRKKRRESDWRAANDNKLKQDKQRYHEENAEMIRQRVNEWRLSNPDRVRELSAKYRKNPRYRLRYAMSNGIRVSLLGSKSRRRWETLVGYTVDDLMRHLERQFLPGMCWSNYGKWHVDHIVPDSSFDYTTPECPDFRAAWALTNLRPLWALDNIRKSDKRLFLL